MSKTNKWQEYWNQYKQNHQRTWTGETRTVRLRLGDGRRRDDRLAVRRFDDGDGPRDGGRRRGRQHPHPRRVKLRQLRRALHLTSWTRLKCTENTFQCQGCGKDSYLLRGNLNEREVKFQADYVSMNNWFNTSFRFVSLFFFSFQRNHFLSLQ